MQFLHTLQKIRTERRALRSVPQCAKEKVKQPKAAPNFLVIVNLHFNKISDSTLFCQLCQPLPMLSTRLAILVNVFKFYKVKRTGERANQRSARMTICKKMAKLQWQCIFILAKISAHFCSLFREEGFNVRHVNACSNILNDLVK